MKKYLFLLIILGIIFIFSSCTHLPELNKIDVEIKQHEETIQKLNKEINTLKQKHINDPLK